MELEPQAYLILYRGHVYAASMNGMPHMAPVPSTMILATSAFTLKTARPGTKVVDPDHQKAVAVAAKATW